MVAKVPLSHSCKNGHWLDLVAFLGIQFLLLFKNAMAQAHPEVCFLESFLSPFLDVSLAFGKRAYDIAVSFMEEKSTDTCSLYFS